MRELVDGEWRDYNLSLLEGKSAREVNKEFSGREFVAKIVIRGHDCYLCGTEDLKRRMLKKGRAATFAEATELLEAAASDVLDSVVQASVPSVVFDTFGDIPIIKIEE
jgi:hypothetical protein